MASTAPLPAEDVLACLAPFGATRTLPAAAYVDSDVFVWEQEHLFVSSWTCVGRLNDLVAPGEVRSQTVQGRSLLVTRTAAGDPGVFYNVCRHRGHELVPEGEAMAARLIRCPYHSWSYRLDGELKTAPTMTTAPDFDPAEWPLHSVRFDVWRGWLFIDLGGDAPTLAEYLGNIDEIIGPYEPERLELAASHSYEIAANWKLAVENYHECYHCSTIHPALCQVSPPDSGADRHPTGRWIGGTMRLMDHAETMSFDGRSESVPLRNLNAEQRRDIVYIGVFPNLLISGHPDYVMTHVLTPIAPNRTMIRCDWLFPPEAMSQPDFSPKYAVDFWDVTNKEDWSACEGVQRGVESGGYLQGPLSTWEASVYQFIQMMAGAYVGRGVQVVALPDYAFRDDPPRQAASS